MIENGNLEQSNLCINLTSDGNIYGKNSLFRQGKHVIKILS